MSPMIVECDGATKCVQCDAGVLITIANRLCSLYCTKLEPSFSRFHSGIVRPSDGNLIFRSRQISHVCLLGSVASFPSPI